MDSITKTHIESRPGKCSGKPCVTGSRIRVQDVYVWHEIQGRSPVDIVGEFPEISLADVHAAIAYFRRDSSRIHRDMQDQQHRTRTKAAVTSADDGSIQSVRAWIDLMKSADKFLLAGFAHQVGTQQATMAYRQWCAERCGPRQHLARLADRLCEIGADNGH